jgi:hypothetical protein
MANTIKIKNSGTASAVPASLEYGELGLNYADGKVYYKNSSNVIVSLPSKVTVSDTPPSSPSAGSIWYESDTGKMFVYYDSFWVEASGTGSVGLTGAAGADGGTTTLTTKGDILTRTASAVARLGIGTDGYFLKANSALATGLEWGTIPSVSILDDVGDVTITTATNGDLLKWNGTAWVNASGYALLASPTFTGTPTLPTGTIATTQSPGANTTTIATTAFVTAGIAALVVDPLNNPKFSAIITMDVI